MTKTAKNGQKNSSFSKKAFFQVSEIMQQNDHSPRGGYKSYQQSVFFDITTL